MEDIKFNIEEIEKTWAQYKKDEIFDGVVVSKTSDGLIFNIGGKSDAYIEKEDVFNFAETKIGDRFKVCVLGTKTDDGLIKCSKTLAEELLCESEKAEKLKIGSLFNFTISAFRQNYYVGKIGQYSVSIPADQIDVVFRNFNQYIGKKVEAIVTALNKTEKLICATRKTLLEQQREEIEGNFFKNNFLNKVVLGKVEKVLPYGAFVSVEGFLSFIHISDLDYKKVENVGDYLEVGKEYNFRIIKIDIDEKKVNLGLKQLIQNPKLEMFKKLKEGQFYNGTIVKMLAFGAVVKLDNLDVEGLLHISDASDSTDKRINEIVQIGKQYNVKVVRVDLDKQKVNFGLEK